MEKEPALISNLPNTEEEEEVTPEVGVTKEANQWMWMRSEEKEEPKPEEEELIKEKVETSNKVIAGR